MWKILKEIGIPDHLTCLLRNLLCGSRWKCYGNLLYDSGNSNPGSLTTEKGGMREVGGM